MHFFREEYENFSKKIAEHVPRFDKVDMINGITTFIHQVCFYKICLLCKTSKNI